MISIPNWRNTFVKCFICDEDIKDKELIAVANIGQVFNTMVNTGCDFGDTVTVGHTRKRAQYFHKQCFNTVCSHAPLLRKLEKSEMTPEDWKYLERLAGIS